MYKAIALYVYQILQKNVQGYSLVHLSILQKNVQGYRQKRCTQDVHTFQQTNLSKLLANRFWVLLAQELHHRLQVCAFIKGYIYMVVLNTRVIV